MPAKDSLKKWYVCRGYILSRINNVEGLNLLRQDLRIENGRLFSTQ
jgi:hypothetical protein